jgi:hypothetical protein
MSVRAEGQACQGCRVSADGAGRADDGLRQRGEVCWEPDIPVVHPCAGPIAPATGRMVAD